MKQIRRLFALLLALTLVIGALPAASATGSTPNRLELAQKDEQFRILLIGNSFSVDTAEWFYDVASGSGYDVLVGHLSIGSSTLAEHAYRAANGIAAYTYRENDSGEWQVEPEKKDIAYAVEQQDWDVIFFQQQSIAAGKASRTKPRYISGLARFFRQHCSNPDVKIGYEMSWAVSERCQEADFRRNFADQTALYAGICKVTQEVVEATGAVDLIAATGTAVQNARSDYWGDDVNRDVKHLSKQVGRVLASMSVASACGMDLSGLQKAGGVGRGAAAAVHLNRFRKYVADSEASPYQVTPQKGTAPKMKKPQVYVRKGADGLCVQWRDTGARKYVLSVRREGETGFTRVGTFHPGLSVYTCWLDSGVAEVRLKAVGDGKTRSRVKRVEL